MAEPFSAGRRPDPLPVARTSSWALWLALALIIPAMLPLAAPGYFFKAHDARHSVYFLIEFDQAFRAGALWPVWSPDLAVGFGYPLWLVYAPLAYFVAEAFHLLGLGFTAAVKVTWALGFVVGGLGMYRLARRWWGPAAGLIASLAFTYAPYRLVQIYVRGALAEFMALAWLPWTWLALAALWEQPTPRRAGLAALAFAPLLMLNTTSTMLFAPLVAGFLLALFLRALRRREGTAWKSALWSGGALALGGLLAGIFLLPLVLERSNIVEAQWTRASYDYAQNFVYGSQFFAADWGFGYSVAGARDGMSFQLGLFPILLGALGGLAALAGRAGRLPQRVPALFLAATSLAAIFLMTPASLAVWDHLPLLQLAQFPWRLLAVTAFSLALLAGAAAAWLEARAEAGATAAEDGRPSPYAIVLALAIVLASFAYTRPQLVPVLPQDEQPLAAMRFELEYPDMRGMTAWSERVPTDADSPLIAQYLAGEPLRRAAIVAGSGSIVEQSATALSAQARVRAQDPVHLRFYTYYFPGWQATVDGQPAEIEIDAPNGLIGLTLPPGEHLVRLRFGPTPVRRAGAMLSLAGLLLTGLLLVVRPRR